MERRRRRTVLRYGSAAVLATLAGCTTDIPIGPDESTDVFLTNETDEERTIAVVIEGTEDDERLFDETVTVEADESRGISDVVDGEAVDVAVSVADGPEDTFEWSDTGGERSLSVSVRTDSIGFTVATAE